MDAYEKNGVHRQSKNCFGNFLCFTTTPRTRYLVVPPIYNDFDYHSVGGELIVNYISNDFWELQGFYSFSQGKKESESENETDFPESMASLKSVIHA